MIIMINGAFGVGKTTLANRLVERIPDSMLFDPEEIGYMLRNIVTEELKRPEEKTDNFQDLALWKVLTVQVAGLLKNQYKKHLIVPMTICNTDYFHYMYNGFKQMDPETVHFCLIAEEETIYERLRQRGEEEGNWCFQQTKKCVEAFQNPCFGDFIPTDNVSAEQIVDKVEKMVQTFVSKKKGTVRK